MPQKAQCGGATEDAVRRRHRRRSAEAPQKAQCGDATKAPQKAQCGGATEVAVQRHHRRRRYSGHGATEGAGAEVVQISADLYQ